jgi:hypothetical protein
MMPSTGLYSIENGEVRALETNPFGQSMTGRSEASVSTWLGPRSASVRIKWPVPLPS